MHRILQTGLASGLSSTSGTNNTTQPNWLTTSAPPSFDTTASLTSDAYTPSSSTKIRYRGKATDVLAPPLLIGAWSWGDKGTWDWTVFEEPHVAHAWKTCLQQGVNFIDTAQIYGSGDSERICGRLFAELPRDKFLVQTKFLEIPLDPKALVPWKSAPVVKLRDSLQRMGLEYVDVYLVHGPTHVQSIDSVADGLAKCVEAGLAKCVGVGNYSLDEVQRMQKALAKHGVPLATVQVEYSLLRRLPEVTGLLQWCTENEVVLQGYSSLAQGRLTGKYTPEKPPNEKHRFSSYEMEAIQPTLDVLAGIAEGKSQAVGSEEKISMSAVALNYCMLRGVSPLAGVRSVEQAKQNCQALGWRLDREEIAALDKSQRFRIHVETLAA